MNTTSNVVTRNRWWPSLTVFGFLLTSLGSTETNAQAILYDNTDHMWFVPHAGPKNIRWVGIQDPGQWFEAQPFKLGGHDNVASVSIPMARELSVSATGTIRFSIWDDNGRGFPGQEVGELGVLDIDSLPRFDFPQLAPNPLPSVSFDSRIEDLVRGETYYVFIDYRDLSTYEFGDVLVGLSNDAAGSNGAGSELYSEDFAVPPFEDRDWYSPSRFFGAHKYLQMSVTAAMPVFDNLHVPIDPRPEWQYVNAAGPDRRFAQQFLMDSRRSLDEVVVSLSRQGSATGSMAFEIWSNSSSNDPLEKIADLGTISDVTQISPVATAPTDFTFDQRVTGLTPEDKYWVVANYSGLNEPLNGSNSIGWSIVLSDEGANGAANGHGLRAEDDGVWGDFGSIFGFDSLKFKMSVESLGGDFDGDGVFTSTDIDLLTGELVAGRNDTEFDLTGNNLVDQKDLEVWLSKAAEDNGLSQAYVPGDSNLDGSVNAIDLNNLALKWQQDDEPRWSSGDFTADGVVNSADLNELALYWRQSIAMASTASAPVPEPSALLLAMSGLALVSRRHRRS